MSQSPSPSPSPSPSGGVKVMSIAGRMARERERLIGMTDEERAWRAKFLKSQILAPEEPIMPKGFDKEMYNPIRRFYRVPLNGLERTLTPLLSANAAYVIRSLIAKYAMAITGAYCAWYYFKYNKATWMRHSGWHVMRSRETVYPGTKDFPNFKIKKPNEYATRGFENSPI